MPLIVNLSTTHTLLPIDAIINALKTLQEQANPPKPGSWSSLCSCLSLFTTPCRTYSIKKLMYQNEKLLADYKLGLIDTEQFFTVIAELLELTHKCTTNELKEAWNAQIAMTPAHQERFSQLYAEASPENPIYLISNSNPLHIAKIIELFKLHNPDILFNEHIDLALNEKKRQPIAIAPNIFLCTSFNMQLYKVADPELPPHLEIQNNNTASTTSILCYLLDQLKLPRESTCLISQFNPDIKIAQFNNIRTQTPEEFFQRSSAALRPHAD